MEELQGSALSHVKKNKSLVVVWLPYSDLIAEMSLNLVWLCRNINSGQEVEEQRAG